MLYAVNFSICPQRYNNFSTYANKCVIFYFNVYFLVKESFFMGNHNKKEPLIGMINSTFMNYTFNITH